MKIFISYSYKDKNYAEKILSALNDAGHDVRTDNLQINYGSNLLSQFSEVIKSVDIVILLISKNFFNSKKLMKEFSAIVFTEISKGNSRIILVLIDEVNIPNYLLENRCFNFSDDFDRGLESLLESFNDNINKIESTDNFKCSAEVRNKKTTNIYDIKLISKALREGCLTLVCGAGISMGAGLPSWNRLLLQLLKLMVDRISDNYNIQLDDDSAEEFNNKYFPSSLILGRYLKMNLGEDFLNEVRNTLYTTNVNTSETINEIVNLARPQRDRKPLDSIITFNFDTLIEENLEKQNVSFKSIFSDGMKNDSNEMPIYHVHGYLPRTGEIPEDTDIVFSEDAYHNQFIEPFSWSNLIQLNKLHQNTCLFIGISLTDPNLRRLLDVANRKNVNKNLNHYIIKRVPENYNKDNKIDKLAFFLEEQDANDLGLNVIWVDKFSEIPKILRKIYNGEAIDVKKI
ncbi:SIR2 family protein [Clostridium sp. D2Q-14]|uniref:TIR domain-containing protein n=1 Tax=Anaeromonas gelatinilytica TaxID=2683194 RepID=UPI00193C4F56|nr:TIR domain-containing protein [Anaeromonas gelatinilytica]MBS4536504.1 SIR2 family protein [Anaeromonas gelatinilytica]